jgi:hypothetical protein
MCGSGWIFNGLLDSSILLENDHRNFDIKIKNYSNQMQASVFRPSIFIEQLPQIPSRHERRKANEGSSSFLILIRASRTIGPQLYKN